MRKLTAEYIRSSKMLAGQVRRYHTWPMIGEETIASHSWGIYMIYCDLFGWPSPEVAYRIMTHDLAEMHTGDLPFPVKQRNPALARAIKGVEMDAEFQLGVRPTFLESHEIDRIKLCDLMQMAWLGSHQAALGNAYGAVICDAVQDPITVYARKCCVTSEVNHWLKENC